MTDLARNFAPIGERQWLKLVEGALKGGAFEKLVSRSDDSFPIQPLYARRAGPRVARASGPWRVLARVDHPDAALANSQALDDLANGADGLQVVFAGAGGAYGYGLAGADAASLDAPFDGRAPRRRRDARTRSGSVGGGTGARRRRARRAERR